MFKCHLRSSRFICNHFIKLEIQLLIVYTQIYRNYSDNPEEYEMIRVHDSLKSVQNETKLVVRSARSLKDGQVAVKLSLLEVAKHDFFRPIMDSIVAKGMTVRQFKEQVVEEAYEQGVDVKLNADRSEKSGVL